jgi:SAM-dependent methyltransferase
MDAWDRLRQRGASSKDLVAEVVAMRRASGLPSTVLDVASGTGRYLRELAREIGGDDLVIACHDRDPRIVTHGRQILAAEGLPRFTFKVGDATDDASYLMNRDADVIIAIGLFPELHSDEAVLSVMRLSLRHLSRGGTFICTTLTAPHARMSPWDTNPARLRPAVRPPELVASWLRATGFGRIDQRFSEPDGFALIGRKPLES